MLVGNEAVRGIHVGKEVKKSAINKLYLPGAKIEETFPCDHEQGVKQEGDAYMWEKGVKQEKDQPISGGTGSDIY